MTGSGMTLERVVEKARALDDEVRKEELRVGDRLLVTTVNSRYTDLGPRRRPLLDLGRLVRPPKNLPATSKHQRLHLGRQRHQARHRSSPRPTHGIRQ